MGLASVFVSGVSDMLKVKKLDPPVNSALKNVQSFGQDVDAAEKMQGELKKSHDAPLAAHAEYKKAAEAYNKLQKEWTDLGSGVDKNLTDYKKAVATYEKQGREYGEKEYMTG